MTTRPACDGDAPAIAAIHNEGIADRMATLDAAPRTPDECRGWLAARGPRHAVVVAEDNGEVVGWASLNPFNPRPAYDHVADFSVYVRRDRRGRGIGGRLVSELIDQARARRFHKLVLATLARNAGAIGLYERLGFGRVGVYHEQGRLDGAWVDVVIMERIL